jgi:hypothetical protein
MNCKEKVADTKLNQKKNQKRKILFATQVGSLQNLDQIKVREKLPQVI